MGGVIAGGVRVEGKMCSGWYRLGGIDEDEDDEEEVDVV